MVKVTVNGTCREYEDGITYETRHRNISRNMNTESSLPLREGRSRSFIKRWIRM